MQSETTDHEVGRWLIALYWHLEPYQPCVEKSYFTTSIRSAEAGMLLARLRRLERIEWLKLQAMAQEMGIGSLDLKRVILPMLEETEFIEVERAGADVVAVREFVLTDADVLTATTTMWRASEPSSPERIAIASLNICSLRPHSQDEYVEFLIGGGFTEEEISLARELQRNFQLLKETTPRGRDATYIYNEYLWGNKIEQVVQYLDRLEPTMRDAVTNLLEQVRDKQGYPQDLLSKAMPGTVVSDAEKIGLIDGTEVVTRDGKRQTFAFTPHFFGTSVSGKLPDSFDQVKLFVASIVYGNRFSSGVRIEQPLRLVEALLSKGAIGPASPIGSDYPLLETAGIVTVKKSSISGRFNMHLVKRDVVEQALSVLKSGYLNAVGKYSSDQSSGLYMPGGFDGPEKRRVKLGQSSTASALAAERLIQAIREETLW